MSRVRAVHAAYEVRNEPSEELVVGRIIHTLFLVVPSSPTPRTSLSLCVSTPPALRRTHTDLALPSHVLPPLALVVISQMSLLSLPADYAYVVAVGTVGVYSVLQYATIKVSAARKAAGVKCAPHSLHLEPRPDSGPAHPSTQTLRLTPRTLSPSATSRPRSSVRPQLSLLPSRPSSLAPLLPRR